MYTYDYINTIISQYTPSTLHVKNNKLYQFFNKYLMQELISLYNINIPETWPKNYFEYILFGCGFIGVFDTPEYGTICQNCTLSGFDIFYQPVTMVVSNPLINYAVEKRIHKDCVIIKATPNYSSVMDIIAHYAELMALAVETAHVNLYNSHLSYIVVAGNKTIAESYKKTYDKVASGEPFVVIDKDMMSPESEMGLNTFFQNVKQNYIVNDILTDLIKIKNMFLTDIGIPNSNIDKKERLITDEVNSNNFETKCKSLLWVDTIREGMEEANKMFNLNLSISYKKEVVQNDRLVINNRDVQL